MPKMDRRSFLKGLSTVSLGVLASRFMPTPQLEEEVLVEDEAWINEAFSILPEYVAMGEASGWRGDWWEEEYFETRSIMVNDVRYAYIDHIDSLEDALKYAKKAGDEDAVAALIEQIRWHPESGLPGKAPGDVVTYFTSDGRTYDRPLETVQTTWCGPGKRELYVYGPKPPREFQV